MVCVPTYPQPKRARKRVTCGYFNLKLFYILIKINIMEFQEIVDKIEEGLRADNFTDQKIEADVKPTYLPKTGIFTDWEIGNRGTDMHTLRLLTADGSGISVNTLKTLAWNGKLEDVKFRPVEKEGDLKGKFSMIGRTPVNPHISGKMAVVAARWLNKKFTATETERIVLPYKKSGYDTEEAARAALTTKRFYVVTMVNN